MELLKLLLENALRVAVTGVESDIGESSSNLSQGDFVPFCINVLAKGIDPSSPAQLQVKSRSAIKHHIAY